MSAMEPAPAHILVIDDEPNLRQTMAWVLKRAGYKVSTAGSGAEAIQQLQQEPADLIFLDLKMPDVDGLSLVPQIRQIHPEAPVLVLTAHATLDSAIEAVRLGAKDYLLKPVDPPQILTRVAQVLEDNNEPRRRRQLMGELQDLLHQLNEMNGAQVFDPGSVSPAPAPVQPPPAQTPDPTRFLTRGPFRLDLHTRHATLQGNAVMLSPTAFDYLATLLRHTPDTVTYEALVFESQGYRPTLMEARDMSRWRVHELRKVLESDSRQPQYIITVRGVGYRLVV